MELPDGSSGLKVEFQRKVLCAGGAERIHESLGFAPSPLPGHGWATARRRLCQQVRWPHFVSGVLQRWCYSAQRSSPV